MGTKADMDASLASILRKIKRRGDEFETSMVNEVDLGHDAEEEQLFDPDKQMTVKITQMANKEMGKAQSQPVRTTVEDDVRTHTGFLLICVIDLDITFCSGG
jgi:hypothetical protein